MVSKNLNCIVTEHQVSVAFAARILLAAMFLCSLLTARVSANIVTYSDSWVTAYNGTYVDEDGDYNIPDPPNSPVAFVVGCGVTDGITDPTYHTVQVTTRVTHPSGGYTEGSGNCDYGCSVSRSEVEYPFYGESDQGTYNIESTHFSTCPTGNFGSTILPKVFGIRFTSYQFTGLSASGSCAYTRNCSLGTATCGPISFTAKPIPPAWCHIPYTRCVNITVGGVCIKVLSLCAEQFGPTPCT